MGAQAQISGFVRWLLTWPILVIVALNIENTVSDAGYSTVINQHWKEAYPVLKEAYVYATSGYVLYPALVLLGATIYEWIAFMSNRMESDGSAYQRWLVKQSAENLAIAFRKKGIVRRTIKPDREIRRFNRRLTQFDLPAVPESFSDDEEVNKAFGSYLLLINKGHFDHARQFIQAAILTLDSELQSLPDIERKTPL